MIVDKAAGRRSLDRRPGTPALGHLPRALVGSARVRFWAFGGAVALVCDGVPGFGGGRATAGEDDRRVNRPPHALRRRLSGAGGGPARGLPGAAVRAPVRLLLEPVRDGSGAVPEPGGRLCVVRRFMAERPLVACGTRTGVGRRAAFGGVDHAGIAPDAPAFPRAVSGGRTLAAAVYRDGLHAECADGFRGGRFALAGGAGVVHHVVGDALVDRADPVLLGVRMLAPLWARTARHTGRGDVRGCGLMIGLERVDADAEPDVRGSAHAAPALAAAPVRADAPRRGPIADLGGRHGAVARPTPPPTMTDEQTEAVLERLADAERTTLRSSP